MAFFCIHCKSEIDPKFKACPYCGEAITDFLRRHLETPIDGKYRILARLGVGGMGEVYKVLHVHLNTIRVIKLMRANIAADPGAHERFLREARLATKIHHPNVATLFDFSTLDDGSFYMVWEHIEGINLHELINQRGPLSPSYAARIGAQALMGLDAVHRAGIVHRDVSPENIMIARDEEGVEHVKIIDLGIAKSSAADDNNTKTGMFVGKWKYCSPEHLGMLPPNERIDGRADIYSFGIVLYEMLTGVPPFQADTPHAYLMLHSQTRPRAIRETNPAASTSPELEALVFRALEKDRKSRFASAREFGQALEALAPMLSDSAGAPPPLPPTSQTTDEATRAVEREREPSDQAATVVSIEQNAPTIATQLLALPPVVAPLTHPPRRSAGGLALAAAIVIALAIGGWMMLRKDPVPAAAPAPLQAATVTPPAQTDATAQPGRLGINAFPWANITSIRNLDNGQDVEIAAALVTPAPVDLPPGNYEITFSNPQFAKTIMRTVAIDAGEDETLNVTFRDPASAALPDFGVTQ